MNRKTAERLLAQVSLCADTINGALAALGRTSSEESLALFRLHSAAILGQLVGGLAVPIWRQHPELQEPGGGEQQDQGLGAFRMKHEAVETGLKALATAKKQVEAALEVLAEDSSNTEGEELREGARRALVEIEQAENVLRTHH